MGKKLKRYNHTVLLKCTANKKSVIISCIGFFLVTRISFRWFFYFLSFNFSIWADMLLLIVTNLIKLSNVGEYRHSIVANPVGTLNEYRLTGPISLTLSRLFYKKIFSQPFKFRILRTFSSKRERKKTLFNTPNSKKSPKEPNCSFETGHFGT